MDWQASSETAVRSARRVSANRAANPDTPDTNGRWWRTRTGSRWWRRNNASIVTPHCRRSRKRGRRPGMCCAVRQVDLPPVILAVVTEYQYPTLVCPCCQKVTRAELRSEHTQGIGERLTAVTGYLIAVRKMTRRDVMAIMRDLFGVEISLGSVQKAWEETADAVESPYAELADALPAEPVVNSDETGSWSNGEKRWVWALCTPWFVFYHIARSRGVAVLTQLLGEAFAGILCSDRCRTYLSYPVGLAQFCWAPLQRTLKGIGEGAATGGCRALRSRYAFGCRADVCAVVPVSG